MKKHSFLKATIPINVVRTLWHRGKIARILLGFANGLNREFVQQYVQVENDDLKISTVGSLADAIQESNDNQPFDVVALDLAMHDLDGIGGVKKFREVCAQTTPIAVMGANLDGKETRDLLVAGVAGYLPYSMNAKALIGALKLLAAGETYVPIEYMADNSTRSTRGLLTGREQQVLTGLMAGRSNKEIAINLNLSEVTIKHHLKGLRSKLGARNRTHAVCRAIELGIS